MIAIIKYNAGNIQSVLYALERIGYSGVVTDDADVVRNAQKVIFPGVGEASSAMRYLKDKQLDTLIRSLTQPVLGICLGMQLLCNDSEENDTECLRIIPAKVKKFNGVKVPQMGWNSINSLQSPLFKNIPEDSFIYNVHSYYAELCKHTIAKCSYGIEYSAAVKKDNFYGVQFHTEKSATTGEMILSNFLKM